MVTLLSALWVLNGFQEGDRWSIDRTIQFVRPDGHTSVSDADQVNYRVVRVEAQFYALKTDVIPGPGSHSKHSSVTTIFKPGGSLMSPEDTSNLDLERVRRMEWTALEQRKGISWSRNWPSRSDLIEAKIIVKPQARTLKDTTLLVTYKEGDLTKAVATVKVLNRASVIEDLAVTINQTTREGSLEPGSLVVTEKLKEIHVSGD